MDSSTWGRVSLVNVCKVQDLSTIVTDYLPSEAFGQRLRDLGVSLRTAQVADHPVPAARV